MLRVKDRPREVANKPLQPPEVLPSGQVVELLLQLVDLPLEVRHLEAEVALVAGPLTVAVQGVPGKEVAHLAGFARHRRDEGAELRGVNTPGSRVITLIMIIRLTPSTLAVKIPLTPQAPPPLVSPQQRTGNIRISTSVILTPTCSTGR